MTAPGHSGFATEGSEVQKESHLLTLVFWGYSAQRTRFTFLRGKPARTSNDFRNKFFFLFFMLSSFIVFLGLFRDREVVDSGVPAGRRDTGEAPWLCVGATLSLAVNKDTLSLHKRGSLLPSTPPWGGLVGSGLLNTL